MSLHPSLLALGPLGTPELIILLILGTIVAALLVMPFWFICKKAGLPPALSLITLLPIGVFILPFILAFTDWPSLKQAPPLQVLN